jgi:hypothetical protein
MRRTGRKGWGAIAGIYTILSIEILVSGRHLIDQAIGDWLRPQHLYPERRPAQAVAILILVFLALLTARLAVRRAPTGRLKIATGATAAVLALFTVESLSLHAVDAVLYCPVGPIMLIGWLWLGCGWTSAAAATAERADFNNARRGTS